MEGWVYAPGALTAAGVAAPALFWKQVLFASLCRSADQQVRVGGSSSMHRGPRPLVWAGSASQGHDGTR